MSELGCWMDELDMFFTLPTSPSLSHHFSQALFGFKTVKNTSYKPGWDRHDFQTSASPFGFDQYHKVFQELLFWMWF